MLDNKKEGIKRFLKSMIPWRMRYYIKLQEAKGKLHISGAIKQFRTVEKYNEELYETLRELEISNFVGKRICELGPGQHLTHAFLEYQMGADEEWLLEIDDFAKVESEAVLDSVKLDDRFKIERQLPELSQGESWKTYLKKINAIYSINGFDGYKTVPDNSIDFCFSYAVLEHIRKNIFISTMSEVYRFMSVGGKCYHTVDYKDHLGGKKNHLRYSDYVWEDSIHYNMDNYTNRIQCSEMCELLKSIGFSIVDVKRVLFEKEPINRKKLAKEFESISDDDLMTSSATIVLEKV